MTAERRRIARKSTWEGRARKLCEEPWPNEIRLFVLLGLAVCSWMLVALLFSLAHAIGILVSLNMGIQP